MRNLIKYTDEEIDAIMDETSFAGVSFEYGDGELTRDTLDDFANGICKAFGSRIETLDNGLKMLTSYKVQQFKGQTRFDLAVVDFGEVRIAFKV